MATLTEEQYILAKQYCDLLSTVDEAFHYILEGFHNYERTEGDRLLVDVFTAFTQIAKTNEQFVQLFPEEVNAFGDVVKIVEQLSNSFDNQENKQTIITEGLYPAFSKWSISIQQKLNPLLND